MLLSKPSSREFRCYFAVGCAMNPHVFSLPLCCALRCARFLFQFEGQEIGRSRVKFCCLSLSSVAVINTLAKAIYRSI